MSKPLGDLIDDWIEEARNVKPYGTHSPVIHYVASKAFQHGFVLGRGTALDENTSTKADHA